MPHQTPQRVLVTGATGFLGFRVVASLLAMGLEVSVLIHPDQEEKLSTLANRVQIIHSDIWNRASLKGRARGHQIVAHLTGSAHSDPERGLTYQHINLTAARNTIGMAVSDGVSYYLLLSAAGLPGLLPGGYLRSKRDAEAYLIGSGLGALIVRAPFLYSPESRVSPPRALAVLGLLPPFSWLIGRYIPMPVDIAARGIAALIAGAPEYNNRMFYHRDLRKLAKLSRHTPVHTAPTIASIQGKENDQLDETPFGWQPPSSARYKPKR